jgi:hypothetical protein
MLRCKGIDNEPERGLFRIVEDDGPAPLESLRQIARIADVLLRENGLAGTPVALSDGNLALELPAEERTFFHNGIVFAALDAFNDPIKSPTLNLLARPDPE